MKSQDMISICIYGSQARRRTDEFSDRDVLIVAAAPFGADDERRR
jgi:predicted nucleotidyltransferase